MKLLIVLTLILTGCTAQMSLVPKKTMSPDEFNQAMEARDKALIAVTERVKAMDEQLNPKTKVKK